MIKRDEWGNIDVDHIWDVAHKCMVWKRNTHLSGWVLKCGLCRDAKGLGFCSFALNDKYQNDIDTLRRFLLGKYMIPHIETEEHRDNETMFKLAGKQLSVSTYGN